MLTAIFLRNATSWMGLDMAAITINSADKIDTIGDLLRCVKTDYWFTPGNEELRLDAVTWLSKPTSNMPKMFSLIAKGFAISVQYAITTIQIIEDVDGNRLDRSKSFKALPIAALEICEKSTAFFQKLLHNPNSSGAAHSKLMNGQRLKNGKRKSGLVDIFDGDLFLAYAAHHAAFGGMSAVRDVRRCTGWSADKIRDMVLIVVEASHTLLKKIGKNGLKWLVKIASAGLGLFTMLFPILNERTDAVAAMKMGMGAAKKKKATTTTTPKIAVVKNQNKNQNNEDDDNGDDGDAEITDAYDDTNTDDPIDNDTDVTDHVAADGPLMRTPDDEFDDPDDHPDDDKDNPPDDQRTALKMGRELAYTMLMQARKKSKSQSQRHRLLMDAIDEKILLNALQKGLRPTDLAVAENMANFLTYCWQWAERKGVFLEKSHQKSQILDMPEGTVIKRIIHAVQHNYWETGRNKPTDAGKIWVDVMHADRDGRDRLAVLTRSVSQDLKTRNHEMIRHDDGRKITINDGRKIIVNPDHSALREHFFQHINRKNWPKECNTRYFIAVNGTHETITAQRFIHPRGGAMSDAICMDENELDNIDYFIHQSDAAAAPVFDFPDDDDAAAVQLVAEATGADAGIIRRVLGRDDRAQEILSHTCQSLPEDRKAALEQMFSSGMTEIDAENAVIVSPSCLNQKTRLDLARLLNLDMGTLEKAFADDSDSVMRMKRAIKSMPEHDRSEAIRKIHLAAR